MTDSQMPSVDEWDDASFLISSALRIAVMDRVARGPATPTEIQSSTGGLDTPRASLSHVSRAIQELRARDLIELLVAEDTAVGRLYGPTERGDAAWDLVCAQDLLA